MKLLIFLFWLISFGALPDDSTCFGTTSNGRLENGVKLPSGGKNFTSYSSIAELAGRTYVHSIVRDIIVKAYAALEVKQPDKVYKFAETGFKNGGEFKPHKTHRNGLSVDFMTPVINANGQSVHLPSNPFNKFGYNIEFDASGSYKDVRIDYEAMAAHVYHLHKAARQQGYDLWRVLFDPQLQPGLFKTRYAEYLKNNVKFSKKRSWVRHDEHYHVDFAVPCKGR